MNLTDALSRFPESERASLVDHVQALARMSPTLRAAILALSAAANALQDSGAVGGEWAAERLIGSQQQAALSAR